MADDVLDDELREDAIEVLRDVLEWRLTAGRWSAVAAAVGAVRHALGSGDTSALRAGVYELELMGPVRAVGFDEEPAVATGPLRTEINELIHTLDGGETGD